MSFNASRLKRIVSASNRKLLPRWRVSVCQSTKSPFPIAGGLTRRARKSIGAMASARSDALLNTISARRDSENWDESLARVWPFSALQHFDLSRDLSRRALGFENPRPPRYSAHNLFQISI